MTTTNVRIDTPLQNAVTRGDLPCVVAVAAARGRPIYSGAFGVADLESGTPVAENAVFRIASMTKAVTSVAAMQLVEEDVITLDAPAADVLPRIAEFQVIDGYDAGGAPRLRPPRRPITVRHLLTHTSGLAYAPWNEDANRYAQAAKLELSLESMLQMPLVCDPGDAWVYSTSTDWLGLLVEEAAGQDLEAVFRGRICDPLEMPDTTFRPNPDQQARLPVVYQRGEDGSFAISPLQSIGAPGMLSGGGGLYSTAADYLKFVQALLDGGRGANGRILKAETVAAMREDQIPRLRAGAMPSFAPPMSNPVAFYPETSCGFSLGFLVNRGPLESGRAAGGLSWAGVLNSYYWLDPTRNVGGVIMTQILPFFDTKAVQLYRDFETAVYRSLA